MAVNYLEDYLGIDPSDYSAMEQGIAGISPLSPEQSILPQAPVMPRASIMDEGDFASATAPLMGRVYSREQAAREKSTALANELQALQKEMAQTSEAEIQKRADLERQIQNIMQERDVSRTSAEDLANQLQGLENNLQEVTQLRDIAVQDYQDSVAQQDIIRQEAAENQARQLEEQRNSLTRRT
jgi:chromosome segregation ATPase